MGSNWVGALLLLHVAEDNRFGGQTDRYWKDKECRTGQLSVTKSFHRRCRLVYDLGRNITAD